MIALAVAAAIATTPYPQGGGLSASTARRDFFIPIIRAQQNELLPDFRSPEYFPALIEHESCISLTHSRCWSPTSRLKSAREEGAGLGQITRAFNPDGSIRFDALQDTKRLDPRGLNELKWDNVYERPDLQIRAMILLVRQNYNRLAPLVRDHAPKLAFTDAAYNGGLGGVMNDRRACAVTPNCDPNQWFGHVERTCTKSVRTLYGQRSACDINRDHVRDVLTVKMPKFRELL